MSSYQSVRRQIAEISECFSGIEGQISLIKTDLTGEYPANASKRAHLASDELSRLASMIAQLEERLRYEKEEQREVARAAMRSIQGAHDAMGEAGKHIEYLQRGLDRE